MSGHKFERSNETESIRNLVTPGRNAPYNETRMGSRHLAAGAAAVAVTLALIGAGGAPRLTLRNDAISIDYPASLGLALIAAAALVSAGAARAPGVWRWTLAALTLACAGLGIGRLTYSVAADGEELRQKSLFGRRVLAWTTISRVDLEPKRIVAWGAGNTTIRVPTARFTAEQRASLEQTISRRVYDATAVADPKPAANSLNSPSPRPSPAKGEGERPAR